MSILLSLSARHLRLNRKRTVITIIGIALSIAMVTAISGFIVSFQDMLYRDAVARDGLWHVRYSGLSEETAADIGAESAFSEHTITQEEDGVTVFLLFEPLDRHIFDRSDEICQRYGIPPQQVRYHDNLLIAEGIIPAGYYESLYVFAGILLTLVAVASVMVIGNAFSISAAERSRQFGLLKSVGATGRQVRATVLWEGVILGIFAIPLGIVVGLVAEWVALAIANHILGTIDAVTFMARFRVVVSPMVLLAAVLCALVTIYLAAWLPARRAARMSAIEAIRQTADIKVRPRDVRVLPFTGKLFGFEGLLAAKTMKRNRGRYRTTVLSLVVSIVLFISVSSFGQMLMKASSMVYEDYGSNVLVEFYGQSEARQNELAGQMARWEGTSVYPSRSVYGEADVSGILTPTAVEVLGAGIKSVSIHSFSQESFGALCDQLKLDPARMADPEHPAAILVNTSGTYIRQGRRHNFTPYQVDKNTRIAVDLYDNPATLQIAGEVKELPPEIAANFLGSRVNLVVSDAMRKALEPEDRTALLTLVVMASDADAFEERALSFLGEELGEFGYYVVNYEAMAANNRNIWLLIMIFIYGFIAMLSLISITNVITTISTGLALRRRELAMLRSIGMTQADISKSLRYESLIYGGKSLLFGIPLGILVSLAMYYALDGSMSFEYIWPIQSIVLSIVAVLILVFSTMGFAGARQRKGNIVSVLQDEIV